MCAEVLLSEQSSQGRWIGWLISTYVTFSKTAMRTTVPKMLKFDSEIGIVHELSQMPLALYGSSSLYKGTGNK